MMMMLCGWVMTGRAASICNREHGSLYQGRQRFLSLPPLRVLSCGGLYSPPASDIGQGNRDAHQLGYVLDHCVVSPLQHRHHLFDLPPPVTVA